MEWDRLYGQNSQPDWEDIDNYINNGLWRQLNLFLQEQYNAAPKLTYSKCSMQRGWNVKYQKSGKSLCTLYPMPGFFIALVVVGEKETAEAELLMPLCSGYIQDLYQKTVFSLGGRWLMIHVTSEQILEDTKNLIQLRVQPKQK